MPVVLGIALGGAIGAVLRHGLSTAVTRGSDAGGSGTLAVNLLGAFLLGLLLGVTEERLHMDPALRSALTVGVLGGFTTFSTYTWDVVEHFEAGRIAAAAALLGVTVTLGVVAIVLGLALGRGT